MHDLTYLDEHLADERSFWRERLGDARLPGPGLPFVRSTEERPAEPGQTSLIWSDDLTDAVLAYADRSPARVFCLLTAALQRCLIDYHGDEDVVIGTVPVGDTRAIQAINPAVLLRLPAPGDGPVHQWLDQVSSTLAEAFLHQRFPLSGMAGLLDKPMGDNPWYRILCWLTPWQQPGPMTLQPGGVHLIAGLSDGRLTMEARFDTSAYQQNTLDHVLTQISQVVRQMVSDPRRSAVRLPLDGPRSIAAPAETLAELATVAQRIAGQVRNNPSQTAVYCRDRAWSYGDIWNHAGQLAVQLRQAGVGIGDRVPICLDHGPAVVWSMLATWWCGAAFIPLDPGHPTNRHESLLADLDPAVILLDQDLQASHGARFANWPVIAVDNNAVNAPDIEPPPSLFGLSSTEQLPAYIIFTSGSTGTPKGVVVSHRSLAQYIDWSVDSYTSPEHRGFALFSSLAFDMPLTDVFTPLAAGGHLVIVPRREGEFSLQEILEDDRVQILKLTPSHLSLVPAATRIPPCLILGGEALDSDLAASISARTQTPPRMINEYGPTEATVGCMNHRFDPATDQAGSVPLGEAIRGAGVQLIDAAGRPTANLALGELVLDGAGLAQGYWRRPAETAAHFQPHPAGNGQRWYRTGDLARRDAAGRLHFAGRKDHQVKFNSYRLELDEINQALTRHPKIRAAVTRLLRDERDLPVLTAYYVSRQPVPVPDLRTHLAQSLIRETIPNYFVHLRRLPLTLNGKVHMEALPDLDTARRQLAVTITPPRNQYEEILCGIWSDITGVEQVGIHNNFFELGGHSLLASQVMARLPEPFGIHLPLRRLFDCPTVAELAVAVERAQAELTEQDGLADLLAQVESLSEDEIRDRLAQEPMSR